MLQSDSITSWNAVVGFSSIYYMMNGTFPLMMSRDTLSLRIVSVLTQISSSSLSILKLISLVMRIPFYCFFRFLSLDKKNFPI